MQTADGGLVLPGLSDLKASPGLFPVCAPHYKVGALSKMVSKAL